MEKRTVSDARGNGGDVTVACDANQVAFESFYFMKM